MYDAPITAHDLDGLRLCPVTIFVQKRMIAMDALRLDRMKRLHARGLVSCRVLDNVRGVIKCEFDWTAAGRTALGLPPEAPAP